MTADPRPSLAAVRGSAPLAVSRPQEVELRARLVARDERALADLIEIATPWLLGVVQGMLQDADEAEDVLLETFRLVWERVMPSAENGASAAGLMPWVLHIARNKAIDRLRARKRRTAFGTRFRAADPYDEEARSHLEPEVLAHPGWQVHQAVRAALDELPESQRMVVELSYFRGLSQSEIADQLSVPLGTVKTRTRLGLAQLRATLAPIRDWIV